jgi:hypothetical protein
MQCAVSVDTRCATIRSTCFPVQISSASLRLMQMVKWCTVLFWLHILSLQFTFYYNTVDSQCLIQMCMCYCVSCGMFNHMYVISMLSFRFTYWTFYSSRQSQFQNCSTETGRNILCYGGKQGECSMFVCAQEQDLFSKYKDKKLNT